METAVVTVAQGQLRGKKNVGATGKQYYSFQGIPYAKPPVGPLRFKAPQPHDPWEGVRDALTEGEVAVQVDVLDNNKFKGAEDCLFINVYTPELPSKDKPVKKAVMVYIHGGGFLFGTGNTTMCGPDYFMTTDIVLVTLNYRLGPFGFLCVPEAGVPGNNGLKDQVLALKWVQQNISQFGGDASNVTIFGVSAGGASVQYHMLSPMTKGLFHKAIAMSGSVLNPWAYDEPELATAKAFMLGEMLGCKTSDPKELVDFLRHLPAADMMASMFGALTVEHKILLTLFSVPTCDKLSTNGEEVYLPESPMKMLSEGKFHDLPYMTGITSHEGMLMLKEIIADPSLIQLLQEKFHLAMPKNIPAKPCSEKHKEVINKVKKFYFDNKPITKETLSNYVEYNSDAQFAYGVITTVKQHVKHCKSPVFLYQFSFDGEIGFIKHVMGAKDMKGASHGDENAYFFTMTLVPLEIKPGSPEELTSKRVVKLWSNFAKTGSPTPEPDPLLGVILSPFSNTEQCYINIDRDISIGRDLRKHNISFWDTIYNDS